MSSTQIRSMRAAALQQRRALSAQFILIASQSAASQIYTLPDLQNARRIAAYFAFDNEIDPQPIVQTALDTGKEIYMPVLGAGKNLRFAPFVPGAELTMNHYGIPEPKCQSSALLTVGEMDVMVIPVVCFDENCYRIGMGAGYYDRTLAHTPAQIPKKIGLAYEMQRVDSTAPQSWDVPMDMVVTEQRVYHRGV